MVGFLGCRRTLPAHVEFLIHQYSPVLLKAALKPLSTQPALMFKSGCVATANPFGVQIKLES